MCPCSPSLVVQTPRDAPSPHPGHAHLDLLSRRRVFLLLTLVVQLILRHEPQVRFNLF